MITSCSWQHRPMKNWASQKQEYTPMRDLPVESESRSALVRVEIMPNIFVQNESLAENGLKSILSII